MTVNVIMFITALLHRAYGYPNFISDNFEQYAFLKQKQSTAFISPHPQMIHSLQQSPHFTVVGSSNQLSFISNHNKETHMDILHKKVKCHPNLPLSVVLQERFARIYDECNLTESVRINTPTDVAFLLNNCFALSSNDGVNLFDNSSGKLLGGMVIDAKSLGTDGVDIYCGGKTICCIDTRMFKKKWEVNRSGVLVMKNGIGIIRNNVISSIDLDGNILWTMEKKGVSCIELSDDGKYCLFGYQNGSIDLFQSSNGNQLCNFEKLHAEPITAMNWSNQSMALLTGSSDGLVMNWDCLNHKVNVIEDEWD